MRSRIFTLSFGLAVGLFSFGWSENLRLLFVRHAQGGHNVVKEWESRPAAERPAYVGNPDAFTPLGTAQTLALAAFLKDRRFDLIAVSPLWRCRNTILPYLKDAGAVGEIWPELVEGKTGNDPRQVRENFTEAVKKVVFPAGEAPFFRLRARRDGDVVVADSEVKPQSEAETVRFAEMTLARIEALATSPQPPSRVLLVGHSYSGARFFKVLSAGKDVEGARTVSNASATEWERVGPGAWKFLSVWSPSVSP